MRLPLAAHGLAVAQFGGLTFGPQPERARTPRRAPLEVAERQITRDLSRKIANAAGAASSIFVSGWLPNLASYTLAPAAANAADELPTLDASVALDPVSVCS